MTIRVAVVGSGWWGQHHLRAFSAQPDVKLVAVVGRDADKTRERAKRFEAQPYTDLGAMLAEARPDFVSLCLPNHAHFEPTLQVIRAGVPLLAEKPLVFDLGEADLLLSEAAARNLFFSVCFNMRFARAVQLAKAAVDEGRLGDLILATWRFCGDGWSGHPWGNLVETQCHGFDMLEHLAGPVTSVAAQFSDRALSGIYNSMAISVGFGSGAVGSLIGSYDDSFTHAGSQTIELVGTRGRVLVEDCVRRFTYSPRGSEVSEVWEPGFFNDRERQFQQTLDAQITATLEALTKGWPPPVPAAAGRRALQLAVACVESWETGQRRAV